MKSNNIFFHKSQSRKRLERFHLLPNAQGSFTAPQNLILFLFEFIFRVNFGNFCLFFIIAPSGALVFIRDSKSGERGEHALAIFLPLLC